LVLSATFFVILIMANVAVSFNPFSFLKNPEITRKSQTRFVVSVVDGDTIVLDDGEKVRYLGIDAPETHKKEDGVWINVNEPFGYEATNYNKSLVEGKEVSLRYDTEKKDVYNRTLAYVYVNGKMVNTKLLAEGVAFPYSISKLKEFSNFKLAFLNALKAKKGLYKTSFLSTKLHEQLGLYGWFRGKINSIYYTDEKTVIKTDYLDIHLKRKGQSKIYGLKAGNVCYFYGKLTRKKDRYIILSDNPHHIVIE